MLFTFNVIYTQFLVISLHYAKRYLGYYSMGKYLLKVIKKRHSTIFCCSAFVKPLNKKLSFFNDSVDFLTVSKIALVQ